MVGLDLVAFVVLVAVAAGWVAAPIRAARRTASPALAPDLVALEAERDARVAAVRDAELDRQTGKLSAADHEVLDAELRAEAARALHALDAAADAGSER